MKKKSKTGLQAAIEVAGGYRALARKIGVTHSAIMQWTAIPVGKRLFDVERVTGIPREQLRPDIYDAPRPR